LTAIPGLGRQRAGNIVVDRPLESVPDIEELSTFATADVTGRAD
jgi:hypothetical protein